MGLMEPPSAATWMLRHLVPGERNEAMAGDLLEEFRQGRSGNWYWRQVLAAIAIGCCRDVFHHRFVLAYAAVWSILAVEWYFIVDRFWNHSKFTDMIYRIGSPWDGICALALHSAVSLAFIASGLLLYLIPQMLITRSFSAVRLRRSLLLTFLVYAAIWAVIVGFSLLLPEGGHAIDRRTFTPLNVIANLWIWSQCLPFTLAVGYGLWGPASRSTKEYLKTVA